MNGMQRKLFIGLVLAGIGIWSYNGLLLTGALPESGPARPEASPEAAAPLPASPGMDTTRTPYRGDFRDPFQPVLSPSRPKAVGKPPPPPRPAPPLPALRLLGILWDAARPVATIARADGRTENLQVGMKVDGATVSRIEPSAVVLRVGRRTMRLTPPGPRL